MTTNQQPHTFTHALNCDPCHRHGSALSSSAADVSSGASEGAQRRAVGPLGNMANHSSGSDDVEAFERKSGRQRELLTMRLHAAKLVGEARRARGLTAPEDQERIEHCMWTMQKRAGGPVVVFNESSGRNSLHGVQTCGKWACPWCVQEKARRSMLELTAGIAAARRDGLYPFMVTLTLRHHAGERLAPMLEDLFLAKNRTFTGRWFQDWCASLGVAGHVRYTEITDGVNGWHPHLHLVWFADHELTEAECEEVERVLSSRWLLALEKHGRAGLSGIAVDVRAGHSATAEYLAKMGKLPERSRRQRSRRPGIEFEAAYAPGKRARGDAGSTPLELLGIAAGVVAADAYALAHCDGDVEAARGRAGLRWLEYYDALHGRQMVAWSDGLKAGWNIAAEADKLEVAGADVAAPVEVGVITAGWHILRADPVLLVSLFEAGPDFERVRSLLAAAGVEFQALSPPSH